MLTRFIRYLTGFSKPTPTANRNSLPRRAPTLPNGGVVPASATAPGTPTYPPVDQGVELAGASAILVSQSDLIRRLKLLLGISESEFETRYVTVIRGLAHYIDLLPASENGTHKGAGGLFRLALELAFYSRQSCEAMLFAGKAGVEKRRELEPRWRYATFLAALCCELHRLLSQMIVVSEDGSEWPVHQGGLADWLRANGASRYYIRWIKEGESFTGGSATLVASKIIPESAMQYLQEGHHNIIAAMLEAIAGEGKRSKGNQISEIVEKIRKKVAERDEVLAPSSYGKLTVGAQLEPYLLDAMRRLVSDGSWAVNKKKARVWFAMDGLFIVWRTAAKEIIEALSRDAVTGIPKDASTIAEILLRAGVLTADSTGDLYWKIKTPLSDNELIAVKVAKPEVLLIAFEDEDRPEPLDAPISISQQKAPTKPSAQMTSATVVQPPAVQPPVPGTEEERTSQHAESDVVQIKPPPKEKPTKPVQNEPADPIAQSQETIDTPKSTKSAPKNRRVSERLPEGPGAIQAVEEVTHDSIVPNELAMRMTLPARETVNAIANDLRAGKLAQSSRLVEEGLAIAAEQMALYGFDLLKVVTELHRLGWLYEDPAKPSRKLHKMPLPTGSAEAVVFKSQAAIDLGLIDA